MSNNTKYKIQNRSTEGPIENLGSYLFFGIIAFITYKAYVFQPLDYQPMNKSLQVLILVLFVVSSVGYLIRFNKCLSFFRTLDDLALGLGIYTVIASWKYYYVIYRIIIAIVSILTFLVIVNHVFAKYRGKEYIFKIKNHLLRTYMYKVRALSAYKSILRVFSLSSLVIISIAGYNQVVNGGILIADTSSKVVGFDKSYTNSQYSMKSNIESIKKIRNNESWQKLSSQEKLNVLQDIANCELNYKGMTPDISVVVAKLPEVVAGHYDDKEKTIRIDAEYLEECNNDEACGTILHEVEHAYQYALVRCYQSIKDSDAKKLRIFKHCPEYVKEISDYKSVEQNDVSFDEYANQYMEIDARAAEENIEVYFRQIDRLLEINGE